MKISGGSCCTRDGGAVRMVAETRMIVPMPEIEYNPPSETAEQ